MFLIILIKICIYFIDNLDINDKYILNVVEIYARIKNNLDENINHTKIVKLNNK